METDSKEKNHKSETSLKVSDLKAGNAYFSDREGVEDLYLLLKREDGETFIKLTYMTLTSQKIWSVHCRPNWPADLCVFAEGTEQVDD